MDIQKIHQYKSAFDQIAKDVKDDDGNSIEVWYARELQTQLGYARWENFVVAIGRAMEACKTLGISVDDHFREVTKMIPLAKGAQREVQDFMLPLCLSSPPVGLGDGSEVSRRCHRGLSEVYERSSLGIPLPLLRSSFGVLRHSVGILYP